MIAAGVNPNSIWAVVKDPGGTNGVLPVVDELTNRGHDVRIIRNGWAATQDTLFGFNVEPTDIDSGVLEQDGLPRPDLLLTSTCSKGGTGMELIARLRGQCPTVALQDIWGGALAAEYWQDPRYRPDYVLANDIVGRDIMCRVWPDFSHLHIMVVGFPAMDHLASFDLASARAEAHVECNLTSRVPVVLYLGGGTGTGETLAMLVKALDALQHHKAHVVQLIARPHPRMYTDYPAEAVRWNDACAKFRGILVKDPPVDWTVEQAIAASDLVVSMASTAQLTAALMGVPSISVLTPAIGERVYREAYRGIVEEFPLVTMELARKAKSVHGLGDLLGAFFKGAPLVDLSPDRHLRQMVGKSAEFAADAVEMILHTRR